MKTTVTFLFALFLSTSAFAQLNILNPTPWTEGTGSAVGYSKYGATENNIREQGTDPNGNTTAILWKATPNGTALKGEGGYYTSYHNVDHTKRYRYSVWVKKTNSADGRTYFGMHARDASNAQATLNMNGTLNTNPYFWYGDLPTLDEWYLLVGFLQASDDTSTVSEGRIYNTAGVPVSATTDRRMSPTVVNVRQRTFLYDDNTIADTQLHFAPAIYEVNGNEPSIEELINPGGSGGDTVWESSGNDINYITGNVGILTATPDEALTVKGKIHAEEVRVDLSVPGPDYVFKKDYKLHSLEEVQNYINEHGHLPNIPSAKEMETNGVELGTMEMKLLEKIEELTLYILELRTELDQKSKTLEETNIEFKALLKRLDKIEKSLE